MTASEDSRIALIESVYGAALEPARWPDVLKALCDHFDCAAASMDMLDDSADAVQFVARVGILGEPEMVERYRSYYGQFDPWPGELARRGVGNVTLSSAIYDTDEKFANEYFLPAGLVDSMGSALLHDARRFALVAVQRSRARGVFSEQDRRRFATIVPHLQAALRVHRHIVGMGAGGLAQLALDRLAVGVIAVDHAGRVAHANKAARAMLAREDGLAVDKERSLNLLDRDANDRLARLVAAVVRLEPDAGGVVRAARSQGSQAYTMLVAPLRRDATQGEIPWPEGGALVLIQDGSTALKSTPKLLCGLYGLTISQAQLLQALLEGMSLQDYAERAGVSPSTVRFHLRVVFAKTRTATQSQLMRKVVQDLAGITLND